MVSQSRNQTALRGAPEARADECPEAPEDVLDAYQAEFAYICRTLARLGIRDADIEDVAHEVFLVLCRKWDEYDRSRQLRPYLFGIAFRVAAAQRRRYAREVPCEGAELPDAVHVAERKVQTDEARAIVLQALEHVGLSRRAVFIMYELDDVPMAEIAKAMGIPVFTAYSRLRKARKEFEAAVNQLREGGQP